MSETGNLARMAELAAARIFSRFLWEETGSRNQNWKCENEIHEKDTHPSDIVFCYPDPYAPVQRFVNVDLKSYARATITANNIQHSVRSLAMAVDCANVSADWSKKYAHTYQNWTCDGLLFIFNHDGAFEDNFEARIERKDLSSIEMSASRRIFILGPHRIRYLASIAADIVELKAAGALCEDYSFHFPDLVRRRHLAVPRPPASLEMLSAPWMTLKRGSTKPGYVVYCYGPAFDVDDYTFLIDSFFRYQMLETDSRVDVRIAAADGRAVEKLEAAKGRFRDNAYVDPRRLDLISSYSVTEMLTGYSQYEIGLGER